MEIRSFKEHALAAYTASRKTPDSASDIIPGIRENIRLLSNAGLFENAEVTERRLNHFMTKLMESEKIQDFAVVNSFLASFAGVVVCSFDVMIKPTPSVSFICIPVSITTLGMQMRT